jgi:hypothetical protein
VYSRTATRGIVCPCLRSTSKASSDNAKLPPEYPHLIGLADLGTILSTYYHVEVLRRKGKRMRKLSLDGLPNDISKDGRVTVVGTTHSKSSGLLGD